ncbi:prolactin-inducible protein-like [Sigmodon hispidus]
MPSLQVLYQSEAVLHLLIVCLLLGTAYGQDNRNNTVSLNMRLARITKQNDFVVEITVTKNVNKCLAVKVSTEDNPSIKYLSAHAAYTACVCTMGRFSWNIEVSANAVLHGKAEVIPAKDVCPEAATEGICTATHLDLELSEQITTGVPEGQTQTPPRGEEGSPGPSAYIPAREGEWSSHWFRFRFQDQVLSAESQCTL